jgi:lysophospholipase L1-like esterase
MHGARSALLAATLAVASLAVPARADGPGVGTPWVVTVGDSYISGEAGRWAGNTNDGEQYHDALGSTAYFDNASRTAETIDRCHRSWSAEAFVGGGVNGWNLACSGARTSTFTDGDGRFKPGLDFYSDTSGRQGQARMLQSFAQTHNVKLVVVSIGGNNFNFGSVVSQCVQDFLASPSWWPDYCNDDSSVTANFTSTNVANQTAAIKTALLNVRQAMTNAGYGTSAYTILVQNYMSPIPNGGGFRYSQSGYTRQDTGGCGFWNADADWANATALPTINNAVANAVAQSGITNIRTLNLSTAFNGRRLCESTVGLLEERGLWDWRSTGAVDQTEWVNQIRTVTTCCGNYYLQESLHPNYWGQLGLRSCVRQAYNAGVPRGGTCRIAGTGKNAYGEPVMSLT